MSALSAVAVTEGSLEEVLSSLEEKRVNQEKGWSERMSILGKRKRRCKGLEEREK